MTSLEAEGWPSETLPEREVKGEVRGRSSGGHNGQSGGQKVRRRLN